MSFRPISLTSFLFKGMEQVIVWYLEEAEAIDALSKHQHALRKGKYIKWKSRTRWDGIGFRGTRGYIWTWGKLRSKLGLGNALPL